MKYHITLQNLKTYYTIQDMQGNRGIELDKNTVEIYRSAINLIKLINTQIEEKWDNK